MTSRRRFLQIAACTTLPLSIKVFGGTATSLPHIHGVVIEDELAASRTLGRHLAIRGASGVSIREGDITAAWRETIQPLWRQGPATIAGLTSPSTLFCLEQLAWQHGLRVAFHAEHIVHADGITEHHVQRGGLIAERVSSALTNVGPNWPTRLALAMASHDAPSRAQRFGPSMAALEPTLPDGAQLLTSWIIAAA
jgi:hypothetical protein